MNDKIIFQCGEVGVRLPLNNCNIDSLILILQGLKNSDSKKTILTNRDKERNYISKKADVEIKKKAVKKKKSSKKKLAPKKPNQKYPDEMKEFVERNMLQCKNLGLSEMINEKFDVGINPERLASYMKYNNLRRYVKGEKRPVKKKLKTNSENPKKDPYDLTINGNKIPIEVLKFIEENKDTEVNENFRDEIIELFGFNYKLVEVRSMMNQFKKKKKPVLLPEEDY